MIRQLIGQDIFTPGPVRMPADILQLGALQPPYFRIEAFSQLVLECEKWLLEIAHAPAGSRVVFLTAAGTAAMEATVLNLLSPGRPVGVVNGGTFGQRFVDICELHQVPVRQAAVDRDPLTDGRVLATLTEIDALLVNAHETSVGHLYDLEATGRHCAQLGCLHIVDAISAFISDPIDMQKQNIDALIVSSHKGLALPPGLAMVVLAPRALMRVKGGRSYYLDFASHLRDGERGQTPFTPAVLIFLQLHERLRQLSTAGIAAEWARAAAVAGHFRSAIVGLPLAPYSTHMPNAMTAVEVSAGIPADDVVSLLESHYRCMVAPNGGNLRKRIFRVAHMGDTQISDMDRLVSALESVLKDKK